MATPTRLLQPLAWTIRRTATGGGPFDNKYPLACNAVEFDLSVDQGFSLTSIKDVQFHYSSDASGTTLKNGDPKIDAVPEPCTLVFIASGAIAMVRRRRKA